MSIINISKMFYDTPDNLCIQSVRFLDPILVMQSVVSCAYSALKSYIIERDLEFRVCEETIKS